MRKHKADFNELYRSLDKLGIAIIGDCRISKLGLMVKLERKICSDEKDLLNSLFSNLSHYTSVPEYAPELAKSAILIRDRVRR